MRKITLTMVLLLLISGLGIGQTGADKEIALIIYSNDLAVVNEIRTLELSQGSGIIKVHEISTRIIPTSIHLEALGGEVAILEQSYEYEPISTESILRKFIGQEIEVREQGASYRGTLLSTDGGIILQDRFGEIQVIKEPTGFNFPFLPELTPEPTLAWLVQSELEGEQRVSLSYLTTGFSWNARYTAVLEEYEDEMDLSSWVSISNNSGLTYEGVKLDLVAGEIHRAAEGRMLPFAKAEMELAAPAEQFEGEAAFEYHLYTLKRPATLEDGEVKQLSFIAADGVNLERIYTYEGQVREGVQVRVEFVNSEENGLGGALPAGIVQFYERREGSLLFIGEDRISHTAKDELASLWLGTAFDLIGERMQTERRRIGDRKYQDSFEITLRNHKEKGVTIKVIEHLQGDWTILAAEPDYTKVDVNTIEFNVPLEAGGEAKVNYTVEYQF